MAITSASFWNRTVKDGRILHCDSTRSGFTLVELLVVITIIGILIALLLPAVQAAREAARRMQCQNNLKQLGLGGLNHEASMGYFPTGGWGWYWVGDPDRGAGIGQPGGWTYNVLPFIEQQSLHDLGAGSSNNATRARQAGTPLAVFNCPSRRAAILYPYTAGVPHNSDPLSLVARGDYAVNSAGSQGSPPPPSCSLTCACGPGPPAGYWPNPSSSEPAYHGWTDTSSFNGISYERSRVTVAMIRDGLSNTYMIGEKYAWPDHYMDGQDQEDNTVLFSGFTNDNSRATYAVPRQDQAGYSGWADCAFGSAHAGGWNAVFCDGSVRTMSFTIAFTIHERLGNRADGQIVDSSAF